MDRRKRELKKALRAAQRESTRKSFPLSPAALREMFDMLDESLPSAGCDHSLRLTTAWLTARELDPVPVIAWLHENGGYCDCEVLNVEDSVEDAMRDA